MFTFVNPGTGSSAGEEAGHRPGAGAVCLAEYMVCCPAPGPIALHNTAWSMAQTGDDRAGSIRLQQGPATGRQPAATEPAPQQGRVQRVQGPATWRRRGGNRRRRSRHHSRGVSSGYRGRRRGGDGPATGGDGAGTTAVACPEGKRPNRGIIGGSRTVISGTPAGGT